MKAIFYSLSIYITSVSFSLLWWHTLVILCQVSPLNGIMALLCPQRPVTTKGVIFAYFRSDIDLLSSISKWYNLNSTLLTRLRILYSFVECLIDHVLCCMYVCVCAATWKGKQYRWMFVRWLQSKHVGALFWFPKLYIAYTYQNHSKIEQVLKVLLHFFLLTSSLSNTHSIEVFRRHTAVIFL